MNWIDRKLESVATFFVELSGNGFNPEGCSLPSFAKPQKPPEVKVPKKPQQANKGGDWVGYDGGKILSDDSKAVNLDNHETYGITDREYGEMKAYNPPLDDLELASRVKAGKKRGDSLQDIARRTGKGLSLIKHYSAALYRANDTTG